MATRAFIDKVEESMHPATEGFEDLAWIFTCDSRNRGLVRQGFDEAAVLWKAVKATSGNMLEIGRNLAGSTVLLDAAAAPDRETYRRLKRLWIRLKNKFRKRQKPEVAPDYEAGVLKVCDELIRQGLATKWRWAGSMLVVKKLGDLPRNFSEVTRRVQRTYTEILSAR